MNTPRQEQNSSQPTWTWPVTVENYDRTLSLRSGEAHALATLIARFDRGSSRSSKQERHALDRLLQPLHDALSISMPDRRARSRAVAFFLREMHARQQPFWAWTTEVWNACLNGEGTARRHRRSVLNNCGQHLITIAYLLCDFTDFHTGRKFQNYVFAQRVFGKPLVDAAVQRIQDELTRWGHGQDPYLAQSVCEVLLRNRSPYLEDLTSEGCEQIYRLDLPVQIKGPLIRISRVLASFGLIATALQPVLPKTNRFGECADLQEGVPHEWAVWCQRWYDTSTFEPTTRRNTYYQILKAGRWLGEAAPSITSPEMWTRETAAQFVAAVDRMKVGEWTAQNYSHASRVGKPLTARGKAHLLAAVRVFFRDGQEWGWFPPRFDPRRYLAIPNSILAHIGPNPRVIADDVWAKLLWAGLTLSEEDVHVPGATFAYPIEMVRALVMVWLFAGLRMNELRRLRVGCIRWQREDAIVAETQKALPQRAICLLDVPINKTGTAFTKPVDPVVGEAIEAWERLRPQQPHAIDEKTGEVVAFLFSHRGGRIGRDYLNIRLIPKLCQKAGVFCKIQAGVPDADARGNITSHRARSTIASQLANSKEPMTLLELQQWLGHRSPESTRQYVRISPTKLARSYVDTEYFGRNLRVVEVLINQEAVRSGVAALGEPWRFYDLGHGYCTYDFFDQCPHRMACAKCDFYRPKGSSQTQMLEAKTNLLRLKQEIPLSQEEQVAVEDGLEALEKLCERLLDVPTPAGPTPRSLQEDAHKRRVVIPVEHIRRK